MTMLAPEPFRRLADLTLYEIWERSTVEDREKYLPHIKLSQDGRIAFVSQDGELLGACPVQNTPQQPLRTAVADAIDGMRTGQRESLAQAVERHTNNVLAERVTTQPVGPELRADSRSWVSGLLQAANRYAATYPGHEIRLRLVQGPQGWYTGVQFGVRPIAPSVDDDTTGETLRDAVDAALEADAGAGDV